ncbi:hypothetical protein PG987_009800 [Apiospora arundinis]
MGGTLAEPSAKACLLLLIVSLLSIPLIPIALVAYLVGFLGLAVWNLARGEEVHSWIGYDGLLEFICAPFVAVGLNVCVLVQKAARRIYDTCGISPHPKWTRKMALFRGLEYGSGYSVREDFEPASFPASLYAPLTSDHGVRFLRIEPSAALDAPFVLSLRTATLFDPPKYDALSYTWADEDGDDGRTVPVEIQRVNSDVGGAGDRDSDFNHDEQNAFHQVFITKNCASALRRLRLPDQLRDMWIDALCINQADKRERTHQVTLMSRIYVGAEHVVVYTGEATPLTDKLFDALNQLPDHDISGSSPWMSYLTILIGKVDDPRRDAKLATHCARPNPAPFPDELAELADTYFSRRWFKRVWVLQEVSLPDPRRTRILCGSNITTAMRALQAIPMVQRHLPDMTSRALHIFLLVRRQSQQQLQQLLPLPLPLPSSSFSGGTNWKLRCSPLLDILIATREREATDPCDKIFGVLGLANGLAAAAGLGLPEQHVDADYALSAAEVYTRYNEFFIATHGVGFFLALLRPRETPPANSSKTTLAGLPSWTADWGSGSGWLNERAVRGFELACSGRENIEKKNGEDVRFQTEEGSDRRVMVWEKKRRIKRGWFSRTVFDGDAGRKETLDAVEDVRELKMDPSLVLVSMYPGVAALLRMLDEDGNTFGFQQVCAYALTRQDVADTVARWSVVVVRGGDKASKDDESVEYLGVPETFEIV